MIDKIRYEWDNGKERLNIQKHGYSFDFAKRAFDDPRRIILIDVDHSFFERRFYCIGSVDGLILTVRYVVRGDIVRIIGAGHWRKERKIYEKRYDLH
jgi:hypothetical protein